MPVLDGARAWLETPTTLKVPEFMPTAEGNKATSYIVARPGEPFSLRYDHVPLQDYDVAWKLCIKDDNDEGAVEQWGGPPLEMRKAKGIVKVRAMRISEDGTRFREFAWAQNDDKDHEQRPIRGTITLSLHLCHFAEATVDVTPSTNSQSPDKSNMTGDNGLHNDQMSHPVLAPPTTRPHGSKLWTWYWRDEEPRAMFHFTYATKEALQAEGIIPLTSNLAVEATAPVVVARSSALRTHKPQMSHGSLSAFSPRDLIKRKQSISVVTRQRGYSTSSSDSSVSSISEASSVDSDGGSAQSVDLESESDIDEGHGTVGGNEHKAGKAKSTEMICE